MSLYRRTGSPFYWSKLHINGDVVRFSTRARTKAEALRAERDHLEKVTAAKSREGRYTIGTLGIKFLEWKEQETRAKGRPFSRETDKMREKHLRVVGSFFGSEIDPRALDVEALERFRAARLSKVGSGTVSKELSTLRQLLKYAAGVVKIMPTAPTVHNPENHYTAAAWHILSREELGRLLTELAAMRRSEVFPWALLRANTGMRPTETSRIEWSMVDFRAGTIELPARVTKNRTPRSVPLSDGAWEALWLMAFRRGPGPAIGRVFLEDSHYAAWGVAREKAGVGKVRPHDLRHTLASYLHGDGAPLAIIRDILGHLTLDMANRYAHTFSTARADAVRSVSISVPRNVTSVGAGVPEKASKGSGRLKAT